MLYEYTMTKVYGILWRCVYFFHARAKIMSVLMTHNGRSYQCKRAQADRIVEPIVLMESWKMNCWPHHQNDRLFVRKNEKVGHVST